MEDWREDWEEEYLKKQAKFHKLWESKYKKLTPIERYEDGCGEVFLTFQDWVKETDDEVRIKTTRFTLCDGEIQHAYSSTSTSQKFLVVNGPLEGKNVTEAVAGKEYRVYNCATFNRDSHDQTTPRCVLVHVPSLRR